MLALPVVMIRIDLVGARIGLSVRGELGILTGVVLYLREGRSGAGVIVVVELFVFCEMEAGKMVRHERGIDEGSKRTTGRLHTGTPS